MHLDTDAAEPGRGFVRADGEDVTAKDGLSKDDGHDHGQGDGDPRSDGQGKEFVRFVQRHDGVHGCLLVVVHGLVFAKPLCGTTRHTHHAQRDDEGHHAKPGDERAVDRSDHGPRQHRRGNDGGRAPRLRQRKQLGPDHAGQRHDGADAQINAAAHDDERHAQRAEGDDDGLGDDDFEIAPSEKHRAHLGLHAEDGDDESEAEERADDCEELTEGKALHRMRN